MNVKLRKIFEFSAGVLYNNEFSVNHYTVSLNMVTVSQDVDKHNIAYERMKYWLDWVISNSILISDNDPMLEKWQATEQKIIQLPDQPVDQLVGILLFLKLTAMVENQFVITELELSSSVGDHVGFVHSYGESLGPLAEDGWWNDPSPSWSSASKYKKTKSKIIELTRHPNWKELELDFESNNTDPDEKPTVFAHFPKNEDK